MERTKLNFIVNTHFYQGFNVSKSKYITEKDEKVYITLRKKDGKYYYSNGKEAIIGETYTSQDKDVKFEWDKFQKKVVAESHGYFNECDRHYNADMDRDWITVHIPAFNERRVENGYYYSSRSCIAEGIVPKGTPYYLDWIIENYLCKSVKLTRIIK